MKAHPVIPPAPAGARKKIVINPATPWLAPLAGYSDLPFRLLCREQGAAVCETEMISAKGLFYKGSGTVALLATCPEDQPLVVQLFGGEEEPLAKAVRLLRKQGYLNLDFNMGCPVRKVFRQKAGAWLMGETEKALKLAKTIISAATEDYDMERATVGFKLRLGIQPGESPLPDLALRLEDAGASWLTLHPRWASQGYSGKADWDWLGRLAENLTIPLLASGDLLSAQSGLDCLRKTGASGLMYARGAMQDPMIFRDHLELCAGRKPEARKREDIIPILLRHLWFARHFGEGRRAFTKLRSLVPRYVRVFRGSQDLRSRLSLCADWDSLEKLIMEAQETGETICR